MAVIALSSSVIIVWLRSGVPSAGIDRPTIAELFSMVLSRLKVISSASTVATTSVYSSAVAAGDTGTSAGGALLAAVSFDGSLQPPSKNSPSTIGVRRVKLMLLWRMIVFPQSGGRYILI